MREEGLAALSFGLATRLEDLRHPHVTLLQRVLHLHLQLCAFITCSCQLRFQVGLGVLQLLNPILARTERRAQLMP